MGIVILISSCALILSVRVHARLDGMTKAIEDLAAAMREGNAALPKQSSGKPAMNGSKQDPATSTTKSPSGVANDDEGARTLTTKRSPLPQPGETITKPLPAVAIGAKEPVKPIAPAPADGEVIAWDKAHLHMNRAITVEGKVIDTKRLESICFLNFTKEQGDREQFYLVVFKDQFDQWDGAPETFFLNKTVRVTGEVEDHKGRPQMKIKKKEQVLEVK